MKVKDKEFEVYFTEAEVAEVVERLAGRISADYAGMKPVLCPVLTGSFLFAADLVRRLEVECEVEFVKYTSYKGMHSTGEVQAVLPFPPSVKGRDVIVVEDIVDTGLTLDYLMANLRSRGAASLEICCLLNKPCNRKAEIHPKYVGFEVGDEFVIGYGLDYNELYRNLPYIGVFKKQ